MVQAAIHVLVVEDDPLFVRTLRLHFGREDVFPRFRLTFCAHTGLAMQQLAQHVPDVILLDVHLGGHEEGLTALPKLLACAPGVPVVIHSVLSDHATVVRAMRQGAHDYIPKHVGVEALREQLILTVRAHSTVSALAVPVAHKQPSPSHKAPMHPSLPAAPSSARPMLGESASMQTLRVAIERVQKSQGSVIIVGESGAGKELVARALARQNAPFIAVDASTLEGNLAMSMLFGHERGAFTGADSAQAGLLEQAHGGVLYLDEIANMSLDVQAKLLRVLQEREVCRLGSVVRRAVCFRLVCATHADLDELCRAGVFRFDLLTRLRVFVLAVPPLRQRKDDVEGLFSHFLTNLYGDPRLVPELAQEAKAALMQHCWPGNVRELAHAAEHAMAMCEGEKIVAADLPQAVREAASTDSTVPLRTRTCAQNGDFYARVRAFERETLVAAYRATHGNISAMARNLHMDRSSLHAKLRIYAIHLPRGPGL